jgi:hypothetical protein
MPVISPLVNLIAPSQSKDNVKEPKGDSHVDKDFERTCPVHGGHTSDRISARLRYLEVG